VPSTGTGQPWRSAVAYPLNAGLEPRCFLAPASRTARSQRRKMLLQAGGQACRSSAADDGSHPGSAYDGTRPPLSGCLPSHQGNDVLQNLTICRIGAGWGFRDVTGAEYGQSSDIMEVVEAAGQIAKRTGAQVEFTPEAEQHYSAARDQRAVENAAQPPSTTITKRGFRRRLFGKRER